MLDRYSAPTDTSVILQEILLRMELLMPKLAAANKACADAARPLQKVSEMDLARQRAVAAQIRVAEQEWEAVTRLIDQLLIKAAALGSQQPGTANRNRTS
jgi:hypothetical protein